MLIHWLPHKFIKGERMKGRHKAVLTAIEDCFPPYEVNYSIGLPKDAMEEIGWKTNDNLQIDIIKSGMIHSINIIKKEE